MGVDGESLEEHLARPQPWEAVVRLFLAVGEELLAAREERKGAGLDDVLVTKEGRVRLRELVRTEEEARGAPVETDPFAFSCALYEALYGEPPFEGDAEGAREPPSDTLVPARIHAIVARGLARETDPKRYPALGELLDDLAGALDAPEPPPRRPRPRFALPAVALAVAAGLLLVYAFYTYRADEPTRARLPPRIDVGEAGAGCADRKAAWTAAWSPAKKAQVLAAFEKERLAPPYVKDAFRRLDLAAAAYVALGEAAEEAACAARTRGPRECLDVLLSDLGALTSALAGDASPSRAHRAAVAVMSLEPPSFCADAKPDDLPANVIVPAWQLYADGNQHAHAAALLGDAPSTPRSLDARKPGSDRRKVAAFALTRAALADADDDRLDEAGKEPSYDALVDAGLGDLAAFARDARRPRRLQRSDAGGAVDPREEPFALAIEEADALELGALAARARMAQARARKGAPAESDREELLAVVSRVKAPEIRLELDAALIEIGARVGVAPEVRAECMESDAGPAWNRGCLAILGAAGEASWSGDHARLEAAHAREILGEWHVGYARALVRQAEALHSGGDAADVPARAAIAILERTMKESPRPLPRDVAFLARAYAALATTAKDLEPAFALLAGRTDDLAAVSPLLARAWATRRTKEDPGKDVERLRALLPRIDRGVLRARALAELGHAHLAKNEGDLAARAFAEALPFAALLGRRHRADLLFGAARALVRTKREEALGLARDAATVATVEVEKQAIVAWLADPR